MTKLSEKIPIKYIKQNKGLQRVWEIKYGCKDWEFRIIPFISIADIIDNAEMLWLTLENINDIIKMCINNNKLENILKYILNKINERKMEKNKKL